MKKYNFQNFSNGSLFQDVSNTSLHGSIAIKLSNNLICWFFKDQNLSYKKYYH